MRKLGVTIATLALTAVGLGVPATSAQAASGYDRCVKGDVCFFSGSGGSGSMCSWDADDSDWRGGAITCSWSGTTTVRSVYNNGHSGGYDTVKYYRYANYSTYEGCAANGLKHTYSTPKTLRSHKWATSC
ncbi:hypothetical protein UK15_35535 [Streptomyces variegatus]|jgi:hypothetical protein|uniref:Peptidase inhibitor n=1 Tax=Streptomyces variegatus TaxID=284040 RepID=A0A0M2GCW0_9ACTN|nr:MULTISPECIES: peptidase inhibitor family I36 protein [Streptomyces]KJK34529.1 hypothetical protein UK15_35535 [Streptomyces variegatus]